MKKKDVLSIWAHFKKLRNLAKQSNNNHISRISFDCTNPLNLEMEPKYLKKSDIQLNPNILRTKNDKRVL